MSGFTQQLIPEGYKQTEVGVIPEEWRVDKFSNVTGLITCGIAATPTYVAESKGVPFLSSTNVKKGAVVWDNYKFISPDLHRKLYANNPPLKGDVLYSRVGTIGEAAVIEVDFQFSVYVSLTLIKPKNLVLNSYYLAHLLNSNPYKLRAKEQVYLGGGVGNLNVDVVRNYPVVVPPVEEQTAIANVLSDVDALITSLEKLIVKKRDIKTAAMQQLLTGKKRLPPFDKTHSGCQQTELGEIPKDWEVAELGNIGLTIIGLTYSPNDVADFGSLVLRSSNVQNNKLAFENNVFVDMELPSRVIVQQGDILVCVRNGSKRLIGKCALIDTETAGAAFGAFMSVYRTQFSEFIFYQFQSNVIQRQIDEIMGATINQITNKDMAAFKVPLPSLNAEKTAIADVLSSMDQEIANIESRLSKTKQLKQGMMQELLTGKTRLL